MTRKLIGYCPFCGSTHIFQRFEKSIWFEVGEWESSDKTVRWTDGGIEVNGYHPWTPKTTFYCMDCGKIFDHAIFEKVDE